jgi:hypothetical protein
LDFPGLTFQIHFNNSLLQVEDFTIFQENRVISGSEKKTLTSKDFNMDISGKWKMIHFGYNNWQFSYSFLGFAKGNLLEKEYAKLILYGNDQDSYATTNWQGAKGAVFSKISVTYAHQSPILLKFLASDRKNLQSRIGNYLSDLPFYVGGRINFYYPLMYGAIPLSEQEFGSSYLETYGSYRLRYEHTDEDSKGDFSMGIGLGFYAELPKGTFSLYLDDIFAKVIYKNLQSEFYEGTYQDSLLHLQDGYEAISENTSSEKRIGTKSLPIKTAFSIGYEHQLRSDLMLSLQYKKIAYDYMNGFSIGIDYRLLNHIPLQFITGKERNYYFEIKSGMIGKKFEFMVASTFYHGLFRYARGIGLKVGIKHKF